MKRLGPMADDLPAWLVDLSPAHAPGGEHRTVDRARMVGVLWRAVEQLTRRADRAQAIGWLVLGSERQRNVA